MAPTIYIAAAGVEAARVKTQADRLKEIGYDVIPWLGEVEPESLDDDQWAARASETCRAIDGVDVFWLLEPSGIAPVAARGAFMELGYALKSGCEVIYSGRRRRRGMLVLPNHFRYTREVLDYLYRRLHGSALPEAIRIRWWPQQVA